MLEGIVFDSDSIHLGRLRPGEVSQLPGHVPLSARLGHQTASTGYQGEGEGESAVGL